jgi:TP901 family phage tail tape measure protein
MVAKKRAVFEADSAPFVQAVSKLVTALGTLDSRIVDTSKKLDSLNTAFSNQSALNTFLASLKTVTSTRVQILNGLADAILSIAAASAQLNGTGLSSFAKSIQMLSNTLSTGVSGATNKGLSSLVTTFGTLFSKIAKIEPLNDNLVRSLNSVRLFLRTYAKLPEDLPIDKNGSHPVIEKVIASVNNIFVAFNKIQATNPLSKDMPRSLNAISDYMNGVVRLFTGSESGGYALENVDPQNLIDFIEKLRHVLSSVATIAIPDKSLTDYINSVQRTIVALLRVVGTAGNFASIDTFGVRFAIFFRTISDALISHPVSKEAVSAITGLARIIKSIQEYYSALQGGKLSSITQNNNPVKQLLDSLSIDPAKIAALSKSGGLFRGLSTYFRAIVELGNFQIADPRFDVMRMAINNLVLVLTDIEKLTIFPDKFDTVAKLFSSLGRFMSSALKTVSVDFEKPIAPINTIRVVTRELIDTLNAITVQRIDESQLTVVSRTFKSLTDFIKSAQAMILLTLKINARMPTAPSALKNPIKLIGDYLVSFINQIVNLEFKRKPEEIAKYINAIKELMAQFGKLSEIGIVKIAETGFMKNINPWFINVAATLQLFDTGFGKINVDPAKTTLAKQVVVGAINAISEIGHTFVKLLAITLKVGVVMPILTVWTFVYTKLLGLINLILLPTDFSMAAFALNLSSISKAFDLIINALGGTSKAKVGDSFKSNWDIFFRAIGRTAMNVIDVALSVYKLAVLFPAIMIQLTLVFKGLGLLASIVPGDEAMKNLTEGIYRVAKAFDTVRSAFGGNNDRFKQTGKDVAWYRTVIMELFRGVTNIISMAASLAKISILFPLMVVKLSAIFLAIKVFVALTNVIPTMDRAEKSMKNLTEGINMMAKSMLIINQVFGAKNSGIARQLAGVIGGILKNMILFPIVGTWMILVFRTITAVTALIPGAKSFTVFAKGLLDITTALEKMENMKIDNNAVKRVTGALKTLANGTKNFAGVDLQGLGTFLQGFGKGIKALDGVDLQNLNLKGIEKVADRLAAAMKRFAKVKIDKNQASAMLGFAKILTAAKAAIRAETKITSTGAGEGIRNNLRGSKPAIASESKDLGMTIADGVFNGVNAVLGRQFLFKGLLWGIGKVKDGLWAVVNVYPAMKTAVYNFSNAVRDRLRSLADQIRPIGESIMRNFGITQFMHSKNFQDAASYDELSKQLQVFGDLTKDELKQAQAFSNEIGIKYPLSANEALASTLDLIKAGRTLGDTQFILPNAADLAALGGKDFGLDVATKTLILTEGAFDQFTNTVEGSYDRIDVATNIFAAGADASTATMANLSEGLKNVSASANATGLTFQDTIAILAQFDQAGKKNAEGGTALKALLDQLIRPKSIKEFNRLNIALINQDGTFRSLDSIIKDLNKRYTELGMTESERAQSLRNMFDTEARIGAQILLSTNGYSTMVDKMDKVKAASERAQEVMNNYKGDIEQLRGSFETLTTRVFLPLIDRVMRPFIKVLRQVVDFAGSLPDPLIETASSVLMIVTTLGTAIGGFLIASAAVAHFYSAVMSVVSGIAWLLINVQGIIMAIGTLTVATVTLLPIITVLGGLLVGIAGIVTEVYRVIENNVEHAGEAFKNFTDTLGLVRDSVSNVFKQIGKLADLFFGQSINNGVATIGKKTAAAFSYLTNRFMQFREVLVDVGYVLEGFYARLALKGDDKEGFTNLVNFLKNMSRRPNIAQWFGGKDLENVDRIMTVYNNVAAQIFWLKSDLTNLGKGLLSYLFNSNEKGASKQIRNSIASILSKATKILSGMTGVDFFRAEFFFNTGSFTRGLAEFVKTIAGSLKKFVLHNEDSFRKIGSLIIDFLNPLKKVQFFAGLLGMDGIEKFLKDINDKISQFGSNLMGTLLSVLNGLSVEQALTDNFGKAASTLIRLFRGVQNVVTVVMGFVTPALNFISRSLGDIFGFLGGSTSFGKLLESLWSNLQALTSGLVYAANSLLRDALIKLGQTLFGQDFTDELNKTAKTMSFTEIVRSIANSLKRSLSDFFTQLPHWIGVELGKIKINGKFIQLKGLNELKDFLNYMSSSGVWRMLSDQIGALAKFPIDSIARSLEGIGRSIVAFQADPVKALKVLGVIAGVLGVLKYPQGILSMLPKLWKTALKPFATVLLIISSVSNALENLHYLLRGDIGNFLIETLSGIASDIAGFLGIDFSKEKFSNGARQTLAAIGMVLRSVGQGIKIAIQNLVDGVAVFMDDVSNRVFHISATVSGKDRKTVSDELNTFFEDARANAGRLTSDGMLSLTDLFEASNPDDRAKIRRRLRTEFSLIMGDFKSRDIPSLMKNKPADYYNLLQVVTESGGFTEALGIMGQKYPDLVTTFVRDSISRNSATIWKDMDVVLDEVYQRTFSTQSLGAEGLTVKAGVDLIDSIIATYNLAPGNWMYRKFVDWKDRYIREGAELGKELAGVAAPVADAVTQELDLGLGAPVPQTIDIWLAQLAQLESERKKKSKDLIAGLKSGSMGTKTYLSEATRLNRELDTSAARIENARLAEVTRMVTSGELSPEDAARAIAKVKQEVELFHATVERDQAVALLSGQLQSGKIDAEQFASALQIVNDKLEERKSAIENGTSTGDGVTFAGLTAGQVTEEVQTTLDEIDIKIRDFNTDTKRQLEDDQREETDKLSDIDKTKIESLKQEKEREAAYQKEQTRAAEDHQTKLLEISKTTDESLEDAVANRDAAAARSAVEQGVQDAEQAATDFSLSQKRAAEDHQLEMNKLVTERAEKIAAAELEYRDLIDKNARERSQRLADHNQELADMKAKTDLKAQMLTADAELEKETNKEISDSSATMRSNVGNSMDGVQTSVAGAANGVGDAVGSMITSMSNGVASLAGITSSSAVQVVADTVSGSIAAAATLASSTNWSIPPAPTQSSRSWSGAQSELIARSILNLRNSNVSRPVSTTSTPVSSVSSSSGYLNWLLNYRRNSGSRGGFRPAIARASGGPITPGNFYEVAEPKVGAELFRVGDRTFMIPSAKGYVMPPQAANRYVGAMGGGASVNLNLDFSGMSVSGGNTQEVVRSLEEAIIPRITAAIRKAVK